MSPIGSVNPLSVASPLTRTDAPLPKLGLNAPGAAKTAPTDGFGQVFDNLISSVIARQEASVSFSLMVETRNKLVESYQELMRMQV
jgi:flagellar hook-basal body complex protein FliE